MAGLEGVQTFPIQVDGSDLNIGIVVAQFNQDIGEAMLDVCYAELMRIGVSTENVAIASVPGALEVPITLQRFADSGPPQALQQAVVQQCEHRRDPDHCWGGRKSEPQQEEGR